MARITTKQIYGAFRMWLQNIGGKEATSWNDVGGYRLDSNLIYGGWRIEHVMSDTGGVSEVNYGRMSNREFYDALHFSLATLREQRQIAEALEVA